MSEVQEVRRMLADLNRRLDENGEDIYRANDRLQKLYRERIEIYHGITGIEAELKRLEDDE